MCPPNQVWENLSWDQPIANHNNPINFWWTKSSPNIFSWSKSLGASQKRLNTPFMLTLTKLSNFVSKNASCSNDILTVKQDKNEAQEWSRWSSQVLVVISKRTCQTELTLMFHIFRIVSAKTEIQCKRTTLETATHTVQTW